MSIVLLSVPNSTLVKVIERADAQGKQFDHMLSEEFTEFLEKKGLQERTTSPAQPVASDAKLAEDSILNALIENAKKRNRGDTFVFTDLVQGTELETSENPADARTFAGRFSRAVQRGEVEGVENAGKQGGSKGATQYRVL